MQCPSHLENEVRITVLLATVDAVRIVPEIFPIISCRDLTVGSLRPPKGQQSPCSSDRRSPKKGKGDKVVRL